MLRGPRKRLLSLPVVRGQEVACDSQRQQSALRAARRTKINSSDPPLTAVSAAYPTPPCLPFFTQIGGNTTVPLLEVNSIKVIRVAGAQFDSATGDDSFLADTAHRNTMSYDFFDGENTLLSGNAKQLDDLVEDDVFRASVTVLGDIDYDTQIGGNTTVPLLEVNSLKVIG